MALRTEVPTEIMEIAPRKMFGDFATSTTGLVGQDWDSGPNSRVVSTEMSQLQVVFAHVEGVVTTSPAFWIVPP